MTDAHVVSRARFPAIFVCLSAVTILPAASAAAQRSLQEVDQRVTELQATVDQLKKETAVAGQIDRVSKQLDGVNKELEGVKRTLEDVKRTQAAPAEAWWALGIVGVLFVLAWAFVSWLRELAREQEAILNAALKVAPAVEQAKINQELGERITLVHKLVQETQKTASRSLSLSRLMRRLVSRRTPQGGPTNP